MASSERLSGGLNLAVLQVPHLCVGAVGHLCAGVGLFLSGMACSRRELCMKGTV